MIVGQTTEQQSEELAPKKQHLAVKYC